MRSKAIIRIVIVTAHIETIRTRHHTRLVHLALQPHHRVLRPHRMVLIDAMTIEIVMMNDDDVTMINIEILEAVVVHNHLIVRQPTVVCTRTTIILCLLFHSRDLIVLDHSISAVDSFQ